MLFYMTFAVAGYFSTFNATTTVVLERPPLSSMNKDYFCLTAAMAICIVLFAAFPVNFNPFRN